MKRIGDVLGWIIPGTIVVVMPKCPACVAAYIALATGVGLSLNAAAHLRMLILILSIATLVFLAIKGITRFRSREAPIWRRGLPKVGRAGSPAGDDCLSQA